MAAIAVRACQWSTVPIVTASSFSLASSSRKSPYWRQSLPTTSAAFLRRSASTSQTATNLTPGLLLGPLHDHRCPGRRHRWPPSRSGRWGRAAWSCLAAASRSSWAARTSRAYHRGNPAPTVKAATDRSMNPRRDRLPRSTSIVDLQIGRVLARNAVVHAEEPG